jgi:hypothetical protein
MKEIWKNTLIDWTIFSRKKLKKTEKMHSMMQYLKFPAVFFCSLLILHIAFLSIYGLK